MAGLEDLLASPGLQSALAAYLGYIGSPKLGGTGRALSTGGLTGLQAFQQAREQQAMLPYRQAQLQEAQARVPYMEAQTKALTSETTSRDDLLKRVKADPSYAAMTPLQRASIESGIISGHIDAGALGITPYQQQEIGLRKDELAAQKQHYGAEEAHYREGERIAGMPSGSDIQQYLDEEGQLQTVNVKAGERPKPSWRPYEKKEQMWVDDATGKSFLSLPAGVTGPAGYKPWVKPSAATTKASWKTYRDPATGTSHTLDTTKEAPLPTWVPYTKPESASTEAKKGADILAKFRKDYESSIGVLGKFRYTEDDFKDYLRNTVKVDPETGMPLTTASAGVSPASATEPAAVATPTIDDFRKRHGL